MSKIDSGIVPVEIGNDTYELKYSIQAARRASRQFGGLRGALERIGALDVEAALSLIAIGADLDKNGIRRMERNLDQGGVAMAELLEPVQKYALLLFTGKTELDDGLPDGDEGKG